MTMTVRDIHERWSTAEEALATEQEIIITRDGVPVAKLSPIPQQKRKRKPFDLEAHRKWKEEVFGKGVVVNWVEDFIQNDREDRVF